MTLTKFFSSFRVSPSTSFPISILALFFEFSLEKDKNSNYPSKVRKYIFGRTRKRYRTIRQTYVLRNCVCLPNNPCPLGSLIGQWLVYFKQLPDKQSRQFDASYQIYCSEEYVRASRVQNHSFCLSSRPDELFDDI